MQERIKELLNLIDMQLAMETSDPVTESYKASGNGKDRG